MKTTLVCLFLAALALSAADVKKFGSKMTTNTVAKPVTSATNAPAALMSPHRLRLDFNRKFLLLSQDDQRAIAAILAKYP